MQNNAVWQAAISSCTWLLAVILGEKYVSMRTMYGCCAVLIHGVVQFSKTPFQMDTIPCVEISISI
jgi:hypothetical protein